MSGRCVIPRRGPLGRLAVLVLLLGGQALSAPEDATGEHVFADFEEGTYEGWGISGTCFGRHPAAASAETGGRIAGWSGAGYVHTGVEDDRRVGTATSRAFEIEKRYVHFLIGGIEAPERCCLNLLVGGKVVRSATGHGSGQLRSESWDVDELKGRKARLQIVDTSRKEGGHLLVDRIVFSSHPDFAAAHFTRKLWPTHGRRHLLVILWDPHRPDHPAPSKENVDRLLFGPPPSVADWYLENSGGGFTLERVEVLGWYDAVKPGEHYWETSARKDPDDRDGDGWLSGHQEKWAEAIRRADREFDFAAWDADGDGTVAAHELGILIVIPQKGPFGTIRPLLGREHPSREPLVVDGVRLPVMAEWYTGLPPNLGAPAHELSHLFLGTPDLYMAGRPWAYAALDYSLMDHSYTTAHLDPFLKLKLGWLRARPVSEGGEHALGSVETRAEVLVLYDPARGPGEYFLVENRWREGTYDAGTPRAGRGLHADGLAVWHILEDPALLASVRPPIGGAGEWGRRGIRLLRANGGEPPDDRHALFRKKGRLLSDESEPANLRWLDGSPSGFSLELLSDPGVTVRVRVGVER